MTTVIYKVIDNNKEKWIVLIHCVCGNERVFNLQMEMLNNRYNIIIIRLEGHGIETNLQNAKIYNVVEEIHDYSIENGIHKIDIMGLSLGAMIANTYVELYPETVSKAFLVGMIYNFSSKFLELMYRLLMKIKKVVPRRFYMYLITLIPLPSRDEKFQRERLYKSSMRMNKKYLYSWMEEMNRFILNSESHMRRISDANVICIYGENDKAFLNYTKKQMLKNKCKVRMVVLKNAGHICNISNSHDFNNIIKEEK